MTILITGGTGFVGKKLVAQYNDAQKIIILTRNATKARKNSPKNLEFIEDLSQIANTEKIDAIINLAGEPIANKRWTKTQKTTLINSRTNTIKAIAKLIKRLKTPPKTLISASAIGFYGSGATENQILDENSPPLDENSFTHQLCRKIEEECQKISATRICILRLGIVLGKNGGALAKMLPAFKLGLGGRIASGQQIMSWVHIDDVIAAIDFLLNKPNLSGIFNLTAPKSVTNQEFSQKLAKSLNRPCIFPMPKPAIAILFGEMGLELLAKGQNVYPKRLLEEGFSFKYDDVEKAILSALK